MVCSCMLGQVSAWVSKKEQQFHGEFIHEKSIFTCKPWFKRLAGISTTVCFEWVGMFLPGFGF
jgi:hypothetical protein